MSDATEKQVVGVGKATINGDWTIFEVLEEGRQYPIKLATKREDVTAVGMKAAKAAVPAVWTYTESEGNPNPRRPGTNYINRYLTEVRRATDEDASTPAETKQAETGASGGGVADAKRQDLIVRQSALRWAVEHHGQLLDHAADENVTDVAVLLEQYAELIWKDTRKGAAYETADNIEAIDAGEGDLPEADDSVPF